MEKTMMINEEVVGKWLHEATKELGKDCANMGWGITEVGVASHGAAWFAKVLVDEFSLDEELVAQATRNYTAQAVAGGEYEA
jgi:hypothetical protein